MTKKRNGPQRNEDVFLVGGGGHAVVLKEALELLGFSAKGFCERSTDKTFLAAAEKKLKLPCIGGDEALFKRKSGSLLLVNAVGSIDVPRARRAVFQTYKKKGFTFLTVVHPASCVSRSARLGEGVQIMACAVVQPLCEIGDNVIVNTRASLDHECVIGSHSHIAPGVVLSGAVTVGETAHLGTGVTVIQGIKIGDEAFVGAGCTVVREMPKAQKIYGAYPQLTRSNRPA